MKTYASLLFIFTFSLLLNAQTINLEETHISSTKDYAQALKSIAVPDCAKYLEMKIIDFDFEELADLYDNNEDIYTVNFSVSKGKAIASYDNKGNIVQTFEKYHNVRLPHNVLNAIYTEFPNWNIKEDVYYLNYTRGKESLIQIFKIKLIKDDKIITVKANEKGVIL